MSNYGLIIYACLVAMAAKQSSALQPNLHSAETSFKTSASKACNETSMPNDCLKARPVLLYAEVFHMLLESTSRLAIDAAPSLAGNWFWDMHQLLI